MTTPPDPTSDRPNDVEPFVTDNGQLGSIDMAPSIVLAHRIAAAVGDRPEIDRILETTAEVLGPDFAFAAMGALRILAMRPLEQLAAMLDETRPDDVLRQRAAWAATAERRQ